MTDEFWKGVWESISEKTSSPIYFTYIGFCIVWNLKYLHVLFIDNHELYSAPKIEYANKLYPFETNWFLTTNPVFTELINGILSFAWHFLPPVIFTFLAIKYLPKVHAWAHEIYLSSYFDRRRAWDAAELEYQKGLTKKTQDEAKEKTRQSKARKTISQNQTQEEKWEVQFNTFIRNTKNAKYLEQAIDAVYKTQGRVTTRPENAGSGYRTYMEPSAISRLDTYEIIEIKSASGEWNISFSPRGKYFVKRFEEVKEF